MNASTGGAGDVEAALARLNQARGTIYYDTAADADARDHYYEGIDAEGGPEAWFSVLSALLDRTHRYKPEYKPYLHLYPDVDLHPDGQLRSIYTGETFSAESLITEDAETDRRRRAFVTRRRESEAVQQSGGPDAEPLALQAQVEKALPFNCEHVVPQSWFGHREPMRGDLHHLFTCQLKCNEFRASNAFFDFADFRESIRSGCGKRDENRFEPNLGKGEVARATLYFLARYPTQIDPATSGLDRDRLDVLLRWHDEFPVSDYERRRNVAIHVKQGNRNPFIDHPEWVEPVSSALLPA